MDEKPMIRPPLRGLCRTPEGIGEVDMGHDYTPEETEFMMAMDQYKRENHRLYPHWTEVLAVLKWCGWEKVR